MEFIKRPTTGVHCPTCFLSNVSLVEVEEFDDVTEQKEVIDSYFECEECDSIWQDAPPLQIQDML